MSEQEEMMEEELERQTSSEEEVGESGGEVVADTASKQETGEEGLAAQLTKVREEARDIEDRMFRLAAEFENYKKRMQRERETMMKYAEENILKELLPSLDNLERAIEQGRNADDAAVLLEGVEMTYKGLMTALEKVGLKPLSGVGEQFDPNFHEALAMEPSDDVPANVILQEYQKGYMFKDRLIRAAKVVVSKGNEE